MFSSEKNHLKAKYAGMFLGWLNNLTFPRCRIRCSLMFMYIHINTCFNTCFYLWSLLDYQSVEHVNINVIKGSLISRGSCQVLSSFLQSCHMLYILICFFHARTYTNFYLFLFFSFVLATEYSWLSSQTESCSGINIMYSVSLIIDRNTIWLLNIKERCHSYIKSCSSYLDKYCESLCKYCQEGLMKYKCEQ